MSVLVSCHVLLTRLGLIVIHHLVFLWPSGGGRVVPLRGKLTRGMLVVVG